MKVQQHLSYDFLRSLVSGSRRVTSVGDDRGEDRGGGGTRVIGQLVCVGRVVQVQVFLINSELCTVD